MSTEPGVDSLTLLRELRLLTPVGRAQPLTKRQVASMCNREHAFETVHLGMVDLQVGDLFNAISTRPWLSPPRSGHLGNWEDIARGRSGTIDYNKAVCVEQGLGHALVHMFNQTEDATDERGDWIYLPGSSVTGGERTLLELRTWDGHEFAVRDREHPRSSPLTLTPVDDELVPITEFHWRKMQSFDEFGFRSFAQVLIDNEDVVRRLLLALVTAAHSAAKPEAAFESMFGGAVALDGTHTRGQLRREGAGYRIAETTFASDEHLVDAAIAFMRLATEPTLLTARVGCLPGHFPVLSNVLSCLLFGVLKTHLAPGAQIEAANLNVHVHWGAVGMAGYPPRKRGYFTQRAAQKSLRSMMRTLVDTVPEVEPLLYVLAPASMFVACPHSAFPEDHEPVDALVRGVISAGEGLEGHAERMRVAVEEVTLDWVRKFGSGLSSYFRQRFASRRSVLHEAELPDGGCTVLPARFAELTTRQTSALTGALFEGFKELPDV